MTMQEKNCIENGFRKFSNMAAMAAILHLVSSQKQENAGKHVPEKGKCRG